MLAVYQGLKKDLRETFIRVALYYGVFIWGLSEFLSLIHLLNFSGILCGWIFYDICLLLYLLYKYKKHKTLFIPKVSVSVWKSPGSLFIGCVCVITFFIAIIYPPNNWDSMTYHLPRIEHWIQNGTLEHYYTSNKRQLFSAPFAEIVILHGRVLSADDWLMNLVQWFAYIGTIIGVSRIACLLGLDGKMQKIAALFFATLPMAILQSTSTQNDLVVTFLLVCLMERFLVWREEGTLHCSIEFGIALGLAILSKGTAYPIAAPIVIVFGVLCLKEYKKKLAYGFLAATICLGLNIPHYIRNYITFGNPIETNEQTKSTFTPESFAISLFSNIYVNIPVPIPSPDNINQKLKKVDKKIYPYGSIFIYSVENKKNVIKEIIKSHEDTAKSTLHFLLFMISILLLLRKQNSKKYLFLVLASWCMFIFCIPWQPWITRLQIPLLALSAPVFPLAFNSIRHKRIIYLLIIPLCCFAMLPLLFNCTRPLIASRSIPIFRNWIYTFQSFRYADRDELIFANMPSLYKDYSDACNAIQKADVSNLGLLIGSDAWEYPLWRYFRQTSHVMPNISHQRNGPIDSNISTIFILNYLNIKILESIEDEIILKDDKPVVYNRNISDPKEWNIIYSSE